MKKYEAPIVELTKFDIEDVITASVAPIDASTLDSAAAAEAKADIVAGGNDSAYNGGIFTW